MPLIVSGSFCLNDTHTTARSVGEANRKSLNNTPQTHFRD